LIGFERVVPRGIVEGHRTPECVKWESSIKYFIISTREALHLEYENGIIHDKNRGFMEWAQVLVIVFGNLAIILPLWLWSRAESRADNRHTDNILDATRQLVLAIHNEMKDFHHAIHDEMKDFHHRLLDIERNRKN
jgi:hypothetical protein